MDVQLFYDLEAVIAAHAAIGTELYIMYRMWRKSRFQANYHLVPLGTGAALLVGAFYREVLGLQVLSFVLAATTTLNVYNLYIPMVLPLSQYVELDGADVFEDLLTPKYRAASRGWIYAAHALYSALMLFHVGVRSFALAMSIEGAVSRGCGRDQVTHKLL